MCLLNDLKGYTTMKKKMLLLVLALLLALPVLGLAAESTEIPKAETVPESETAPETTVPFGMMRWHRRNSTPGQADPSVPFGSGQRRWNQAPGNLLPFADENGDGLCDVCGREPGTNPQSPGFTDEDGDGVCDHLGTGRQPQGRMGMRGLRCGGMRGPMRRGAGQNNRGTTAFGRGCHRR